MGAINFPKACLVSDATAAALRKKLEHTNNTIITIADEYRSTLSTLNIGEVCGRREFLLYLEIKSIESFIDVLVSAFVLTRKEAHFHFFLFCFKLWEQIKDSGEGMKNSWFCGIEVPVNRIGDTSCAARESIVHDCVHAGLQPG